MISTTQWTFGASGLWNICAYSAACCTSALGLSVSQLAILTLVSNLIVWDCTYRLTWRLPAHQPEADRPTLRKLQSADCPLPARPVLTLDFSLCSVLNTPAVRPTLSLACLSVGKRLQMSAADNERISTKLWSRWKWCWWVPESLSSSNISITTLTFTHNGSLWEDTKYWSGLFSKLLRPHAVLFQVLADSDYIYRDESLSDLAQSEKLLFVVAPNIIITSVRNWSVLLPPPNFRW